MATLKQLQNAYANPNTRDFLDFIAQAEGVKHGYNTLFGNERFGNLGAHPNVKKSFTQTDGKTNYTTAAGRYQFLKGTWDGLANRYGFADFSPRSQDLGAIALISGRGALEDVLNGNYQSAIKKLGGEWASLPSSKYAQAKRSWDFVSKHLGGQGATQPTRYKSLAEFQQAISKMEAKPKKASTRFKSLAEFEDAIAKMDSKAPAQRYKSLEDFQNAIRLLGD